GLGAGKTPASARGENQGGTVPFWLAAERKRRAGHLRADVDAVSNGELESGGQALLPGAAAEFRRGAHFRTLRPVGPGGGHGLPQQRPAVAGRAARASCL